MVGGWGRWKRRGLAGWTLTPWVSLEKPSSLHASHPQLQSEDNHLLLRGERCNRENFARYVCTARAQQNPDLVTGLEMHYESHDLQGTEVSPWGEAGYFLEALLSYSPNTSQILPFWEMC